MNLDRHKEMYSPDNHREYTLMDKAPQFSIQGLLDALAEVGGETEDAPTEEYAMMLEVTMAACPPLFSWNVGMVMHVIPC